MKYTIFEILDLAWIPVFFGIAGAPIEQPECHSYLMTAYTTQASSGKIRKPLRCVDPRSVWEHTTPPRDDQGQPNADYTQAWDISLGTVWSGTQLEGSNPACEHRSIRWNNPITNFDVNADGKPDMIIPVSCYQGADPEPGEYHNRQVVGAWLMFCSSDTGHYNCTSEYFDQDTIPATLDDPLGGSPYTHVMQQPADINGNGHPDFWYALNRDDGRPYIDPNDPASVEIYQELCGPQADKPVWDRDCTWRSVQTLILSTVNSQGKLKYQVVEIPWGPRHTQAVVAVPNHLGGYDLLGFNYGEWTAARVHADNTVEDVSAEYQDYTNVWPVLAAQPYAQYFHHQDTHYVVTAEVPMEVLANPDAGEWGQDHIRDPFVTRGFTLWQWHPGQGFSLADFFVPDDQDRFVYTEDLGNGNLQEMPGAFIRDIPVYMPMWHFFRFVQLHPDEDPVLVVLQEAKTRAGPYLYSAPLANTAYTMKTGGGQPQQTQLVPFNVIQAFYIDSGILIPRSQSVVEGDLVWNMPHMEFADLDGDGVIDMYAAGGNNTHGKVYLNNGSGTLRKVRTAEAFPEFDQSRPGGYMAFALDLGDAPYLDLVFWEAGIIEIMDWMDSDYVHSAPPLGVVPSVVSIDEFPFYTPAEINQAVSECQLAGLWMGSCQIH